MAFNSYRRAGAKENRWRFQGQEHIDELGLGWDSFKWRNHQPDIGRFFNVDPLAEKFYYNSPYAFSENKVTSHVELEGLEKVFFQNALAYNSGFKKAYRVQRKTSGGERFHAKLKSQTEYNVLYFQFDGWASGVSKSVSSINDFSKLQKTYSSIFGALSKKGVEDALEGKKLIMIGIDRDDVKNPQEGTYTLNHEEFHAESSLDGNENEDKNSQDHEKYYGERRSDSPDDSDVKTESRYAGSMAKQQYDEIDKIIEEDEKTGN